MVKEPSPPTTSEARAAQRPWRYLLALLAAFALIAGTAACSSDSNDDSGSSSDNGSPQTTQPSDTDDDSEPVFAPSGTVKVGVSTNVQTYDPHMAAVAQEYYLNPVFDTLVHSETDGTFAPGLAEDWEWLDRTTLELTLRENLEFSDGAALDAAAVVANIERGMAMESSPSAGFFNNIASVTATDDRTVEIELVEPTTDMFSNLSRLPGMMMSPASFESGNPDTDPVGAGGWVYDKAASNPGEVEVFRANPTYWDPSRVKVEVWELRALEPDAATNALLSGEIVIGELRSEADTATFEESPQFNLISRPNANLWYIQIMDTDGTLLEPMGDVRVRQALSYAIDREGFSEGLQFGNGDPHPGVWLEGTPYYDASLEDLAYDPDKARELLAEAGYEDGFSVTFPSFGAIVPVAEAVQQMWAEIGIDVTVELVEPGTLAAVMRNGKTIMTPTNARGFTAESQYKERMAPGSPYDPIGTDRGELASLAKKAMEAEEVEDQDKAWTEVFAYAVREGYVIVIGHSMPKVIVSTDLDGAVLRPADNIPQPLDISIK
ncbi:MAG: ABC transporter substrate-binding protein [Acidimicrobiia bacterium]